MQGEFAEENIFDFFRNAYEQRKSPSEFFNFQTFSAPSGTDDAYSRAKANIPRFSFYYLVFLAISFVLVVFSRAIILVPLLFCVATAFLSFKQYNVSGMEISPRNALYVCVGGIVLLGLISKSIVSSYLFMIAFGAISVSLILTHACLMELEEENKTQSV